MRAVLVATTLLLPVPNDCYSQQITTGNNVNVPANGASGGQNASVWKAECPKGMVMTGIEMLVGGTCHNQCDGDGRPVTTYRLRCSQLQAGSPAKILDEGN